MKRISLIALLLICCLLLAGCTEFVKIEGHSMAPTLQDGDVVHIEHYGGIENVSRFDVVLLRYPGKDWMLVKRIAGLPGDTVEIRDGILFINGVQQEEPWVAPENRSHEDYGPVTVPEAHLFILSDNRANGIDSRHDSFGLLPMNHLIAHVVQVVSPEPRFLD